MGKVPVRMKAVIYYLSPFEQQIMPGLWKHLPSKLTHKVTENWTNATLLLAPLVGVHLFPVPNLACSEAGAGIGVGAALYLKHIGIYFEYVKNYQEKEKMHHRF